MSSSSSPPKSAEAAAELGALLRSFGPPAPIVVEPPPLPVAEGEIVNSVLIANIRKAYGIKYPGGEDNHKFVGGTKVWWREGPSAAYVFPGVMKKYTTDEALLYCWRDSDLAAKVQMLRKAKMRHVDVIHIDCLSPMAPICSQPVTDYTNIIVTNFEGVRDTIISHFHALVPLSDWYSGKELERKKCSYCTSRIKWMCGTCYEDVPLCANKSDCLRAHWHEMAINDERSPTYYPHDQFVSQLFADRYIDAKFFRDSKKKKANEPAKATKTTKMARRKTK